MSRELTEKLLKAFVDTGDMHMSYRELAAISAKEIEGLLAAEREKVREMCAKVADSLSTAEPIVFGQATQVDIARRIRQLDLKHG